MHIHSTPQFTQIRLQRFVARYMYVVVVNRFPFVIYYNILYYISCKTSAASNVEGAGRPAVLFQGM